METKVKASGASLLAVDKYMNIRDLPAIMF